MPDPDPTVPAVGAFDRFRFDVPEGYVWTGAELWRDRVHVQGTPWDGADLVGEEREDALDAVWAAHLAQIRRGQQRERPEPVPGAPEPGGPFLDTSRQTLPDGREVRVSKSEYRADSPAGDYKWSALLDGGAVLVWIEFGSEAPATEAEARLLDRAAAVRVVGDPSFGEADWQYGGGFALAEAPPTEGTSETSYMYFEGPHGDLTLIASRSVVPGASLLNRFAYAAEVAGADLPDALRRALTPPPQPPGAPPPPPAPAPPPAPPGSTNKFEGYRMEFVRADDRTAAGLSGQEVIVETENRPPDPRRWTDTRTMRWEHRRYGREFSVEIKAEANGSSGVLGDISPRQVAVADWDALIDSLRPAQS